MLLSKKLTFTFLIIHVSAFAALLLDFPVQAEAQPSFTTTLPEKVDQIASLHEKAEHLIVENKFREAVEVYSEILLIEPDDEAAYTNLGHAYMILGDFGRAKDAFQNALHINPENQGALLGLQKIVDPDSTLNSDDR